MPEQHGLFKGVTLIIDGTDCPIDRPGESKEVRMEYSSGRNKDNQQSKYNLKYTVAVQISSGRICSISGPDPGSVHDITQLRKSISYVQIINKEPLEIMLGDKGYQGAFGFLSPIKGSHPTPDVEAFNEVIASVRQLVECVLQRIKIFGILGKRGRFHADRSKHKQVFNICCQITNLSMKREPVWLQANQYLY